MPDFDPATQPPDDWFPDEDEIRMVCPNCGSEDYVYVAEVYDDDEYLGSGYDCNECGRSFTMDDSIEDGYYE